MPFFCGAAVITGIAMRVSTHQRIFLLLCRNFCFCAFQGSSRRESPQPSHFASSKNPLSLNLDDIRVVAGQNRLRREIREHFNVLVNEAKLTEPVKGTSGYVEQFSTVGPHDPQGRSLRDLDLTTRLFKYPCSYLIYSEAFDGLPAESRDYVWRRLFDILSGHDQSEKFAHLSGDDRQAILAILRATKSNLPDYYEVIPEATTAALNAE